MVKVANSFRQVKLPDGTTRMFVDEDEFPWATQRDSLRVEKIDGLRNSHWVTVTILVDGPVTLP